MVTTTLRSYMLTRDIYRLGGNVAAITCLYFLTLKYIDKKMKNTSLKKVHHYSRNRYIPLLFCKYTALF